MDRCILIPSYQPTRQLLETIRSMQAVGFTKIIVVDDGSDKTCTPLFEEAANLGATVLRHAVNYGKGRALKTGFDYILQNLPQHVAVAVDGDGQHRAEDAWEAAELAQQYPDRMIMGCRNFSEKMNIPLPNLIGNLATKAAFYLLTGYPFADTQCGLRAYSPAAMSALSRVGGDRFEYESNQLIAVTSQHIPVVEFPIKVHYEPKNEYVTTYRRWVDSARIFRTLINATLSPLLVGLLCSLSILTLSCFPATNLLHGILAGGAVVLWKMLHAFISRKRLASALFGLAAGAVYGALFWGLLACGIPAVGAFWILWLPFGIGSFMIYRRINDGCPSKFILRVGF